MQEKFRHFPAIAYINPYILSVMAQFKRLKEGRSGLTIIEVYGEVTHGELLKFLESQCNASDMACHAIFDFRAASLSALSMSRIIETTREYGRFFHPGARAAMVFSNPSDFSIGKLISKAISRHGYLSEIRGFYNVYLAKAWLLYRQPACAAEAIRRTLVC